mgnify:CR=1 FL=1
MLHLDREKYLQILRVQGLAAALTALHRDRDGFEFETFEGAQGYQPKAWTTMLEINQFSRELWDTALQEGIATSQQQQHS